MAFTGTDAKNALAGAKTTADVDRLVKSWVKNGNVPSWLKDDDWPDLIITGPRTVGGMHTLIVRPAPDYAAVGTDADPFTIGRTSQTLDQFWADHYDAIAPSGKLITAMENAPGNPRIAYTDPKAAPFNMPVGAIGTPAALDNANAMRKTRLAAAGVGPRDGVLLHGYRKSYITRPKMTGSHIAIFGGRYSKGSTIADGARVQPHSGGAHVDGYSDYSQAISLVSRKATLDGKPVDLVDDVFLSKDPAIYGLVSDEYPDMKNKTGGLIRFNPTFPNVDNIGAAFTPDAIAAKKETSGGGAAATSTQAAVMTYVPAVIGGALGVAVATLASLSAWPMVAAGIAGGIIGRWWSKS